MTYLEYIKNSYNPTAKNEQSIRKWAKDMKRYFIEEDIHMASKHMKRCSKSLDIREIQIITTERYYYIHIILL